MAVEAPSVSPKSKEKVKDAFERGWNVIVWNDPVNLMSYVVYVFQKVLGFSHKKATVHMLEVHQEGKSCVANETKEKAEHYAQQLLHFGLKTTIEKVKS
ncbi:MAG: ATP-dependent Clp protease adapter ClpS [Verrucomicrobiota bacterium]